MNKLLLALIAAGFARFQATVGALAADDKEPYTARAQNRKTRARRRRGEVRCRG